VVEERSRLALVIVWSSAEPARVGEVALLPESESNVIDVAGALRDLTFWRQRPGVMEAQPPLLIEAAPLTTLAHIGDTIEFPGQLLLYVTERPAKMPANAGTAGTPIEMPFGEPDNSRIIGESPAAWRLRRSIAYAAATDDHVLVTGETGTGKEAVANAVHARSARRSGPFVARNAAAIPTTLIDAELFGNAKNYPNPGMAEREGLVGEANHGVLFLDEIGELPHELHARLLRVTDPYGDYQRLGESKRRTSNLRLIGATNRDASSLKEDLLARLKTQIRVPSFSERREDIPFMIRKIVLKAAAQAPTVRGHFVHEVNGRKEPRIRADLVNHLVRMPMRTNYRQIDGILNAAMQELAGDELTLTPSIAALDLPPAEPTRAPTEPPRPEIQREDVTAALDASRGMIAPAARVLGISRQALYRLMDAFGIARK
jgi:two-component system nitrogen regulation response regulator GlnG/two-component system response regulator HydG